MKSRGMENQPPFCIFHAFFDLPPQTAQDETDYNTQLGLHRSSFPIFFFVLITATIRHYTAGKMRLVFLEEGEVEDFLKLPPFLLVRGTAPLALFIPIVTIPFMYHIISQSRLK